MADQTPPAHPDLLLNLDVFTSRRTVLFRNVEYEIRSSEEFSIIDDAKIVALGRRLDAAETRISETAQRGEDPTAADAQEYSVLLETICRRVLIAPDTVHTELGDANRARVVRTFSLLRLGVSLQPIEAKQEAPVESAAETIGAS